MSIPRLVPIRTGKEGLLRACPGGRLNVPSGLGVVILVSEIIALSLTGRLAPHSHTEPEPLCGLHLERNPIYVIDPQGRIVRTLGD